MGPQPGEAGDHIPHRQVRHAASGGGQHRVQPGGGGGHAVPVLLVGGGGAQQQVAVHRGAHQDALAHGGGQLEDGAVHDAAVLLVQQAVFAPAGHGVVLLVAQLVMQRVAVHPGAAHHHPGLHVAPGGVQGEVVTGALDGLHGGVKLEPAAVFPGVFVEGDGHAEGAHDGAGGGVQRSVHLVAEGRLLLPQCVAPQDFQPLDVVLLAPLVQLPQPGHVRLVEAQHQGAVAPVVKVQLPAQLLHHLAAFHVEAGLQRAGGRVKARVHDGAVGLGGAHAHVLAPLHQTHI